MDVDEEANTYMGQGEEIKSESLSSLPLPPIKFQLLQPADLYPVHTHCSGSTSIETSTSPDMYMYMFNCHSVNQGFVDSIIVFTLHMYIWDKVRKDGRLNSFFFPFLIVSHAALCMEEDGSPHVMI